MNEQFLRLFDVFRGYGTLFACPIHQFRHLWDNDCHIVFFIVTIKQTLSNKYRARHGICHDKQTKNWLGLGNLTGRFDWGVIAVRGFDWEFVWAFDWANDIPSKGAGTTYLPFSNLYCSLIRPVILRNFPSTMRPRSPVRKNFNPSLWKNTSSFAAGLFLWENDHNNDNDIILYEDRGDAKGVSDEEHSLDSALSIFWPTTLTCIRSLSKGLQHISPRLCPLVVRPWSQGPISVLSH